jgi:potassium-transporting ATPase KdpC subunit
VSILKTSLISLLLLTLLTGIIYPLFMFGVGQIFFRGKANGSLYYYQNGKVIGSEWIGQNFTRPEYFHPRPSAANYDASNSSGSNLGPTSQKLIDGLKVRTAAYRSENGLSSSAVIPAEAVTTSGSGLDPHISVENALLQASRVADARGISLDDVETIIDKYTNDSFWGLFGSPRVNVLRVNLALDGESNQ